MSISYDKRRIPSAKDASRKEDGPSSQVGIASTLSNSAMASAMGYRDAGGDALGLKSAMEAKAMSVIRPGRFGADYEEPQAEAEADRIGSRFSGVSGYEELKSRMGSALGADFSSIRFHTGADAASMAAASDAKAFTSGRDIYMGGGGFDAATAAHEMVHTIQQGAVQASVPTLSAPTGSVQYAKRFEGARKWMGNTHLGRAHHKALDQFNEHKTDFDRMSLGDRALWAIKNPLAYIRGRSGTGQAGTDERKAKWEEEGRKADKLSKLWRKGRTETGEYDESILQDATPDPTPAPAPAPASTTAPAAGAAGQAAGTALPEPEEGTMEHAAKAGSEVVGNATGDLGLGIGVSFPGLPIDIAGVHDSRLKIKARSKTAGLNDSGMDAAGAIGGAIGALGDASSAVGNFMEAHEKKKKGNRWGARASRARGVADTISTAADVVGAVPGLGTATASSVMSGTANTIRAGTDFGAAIGNGITQHRMRKRGQKNTDRVAALEGKTDLSADEKKELSERKSRGKIIEQLRRASRVRKNESLVSGAANTARAAGNWTAAGLGIGALATGGVVLEPAANVANFTGAMAGSVTEAIGGLFTGHQRRKLRKDTVNDEIGLDAKIAALRSGDAEYIDALGISADEAKEMSERDAKHLILRSMGFKSGKRKEAFNRITQKRAKALTDRANQNLADRNAQGASRVAKSEELEMMEDMFLDTDAEGKFSAEAVAEKLGLEEMEDDNPFESLADEHEKRSNVRKAARSRIANKFRRNRRPAAPNTSP